MISERSATPWATSARDLYLVAMAVFLVTIVIGILNGADAVEFDRNQILTHVHSGTVGWLSLTIVASAFLLFRSVDRRIMLTLAVLVPIYVLAFYTGNFAFRAISGTALLAGIVWLLYWAWTTYLGGDRTLPRLAVTLGLTTFTYGAIVGVLMQVGFALELTILPGDNVGAHASAMTFGYLVLTAMGLIEWRLLGTRDLPTLGLVQIWALFLGGMVISGALLAGAEQIGGMVYLLMQLVAVVIFVIRIWPRAFATSWTDGAARHFAIASIWAVAALLLFMYLVFSFISAANPDDPAAFPINVLLASDHAVYIGVITNIVLGLLSLLFLRGRAPGWVSQVIFWGVNLGLLVFAIGLILDTAEIKRIGAPVMGVTLLLALGLLAMRAWGAGPDADTLDATG
jgi:hypothetical protein